MRIMGLVLVMEMVMMVVTVISMAGRDDLSNDAWSLCRSSCSVQMLLGPQRSTDVVHLCKPAPFSPDAQHCPPT